MPPSVLELFVSVGSGDPSIHTTKNDEVVHLMFSYIFAPVLSFLGAFMIVNATSVPRLTRIADLHHSKHDILIPALLTRSIILLAVEQGNRKVLFPRDGCHY